MRSIREVLTEGTSLLKESHYTLDTPFLDAVVLLSFILNISKEKLLASYPDLLNESDYKVFINMLKKRINNTPVSYLIGQKEFFGLKFYVDKNVLVPRPDSETLVEKALQIIEQSDITNNILDLCTGSGALGIALKHTIPKINITCSDISLEAVKICRKNSIAILGKEIKVIQSDLFENVDDKFDLIITNPPYLTSQETMEMMGKGWKEPGMALDGGTDGLDFIKKIIDISPDYMNKNAYILIESGIDQTNKIRNLLDSGEFYNTSISKDLTGRNRVTIGQRI